MLTKRIRHTISPHVVVGERESQQVLSLASDAWRLTADARLDVLLPPVLRNIEGTDFLQAISLWACPQSIIGTVCLQSGKPLQPQKA